MKKENLTTMGVSNIKQSAQQQMNVEDTNKQDLRYSGVEIQQIEETPFSIITDGEKMWGSLAEYRVTETYEKSKKGKSELEKDLKTITWDRITQVMYLMIEKELKFRKLMNEIK